MDLCIFEIDHSNSQYKEAFGYAFIEYGLLLENRECFIVIS